MWPLRSIDLDALPRRAVMIIDLRAVQDNFLTLQIRSRKCSPVVKGDAYGHGLEACAAALAEVGADTLFVAHCHEGLAIRRLLPHVAIGVLNGLEGNTPKDFVESALYPVLSTLEDVSAWQAIGGERQRPPCFIHIDTGMNRLGITEAESPHLALVLRSKPLNILGYISHFARSDEGDIETCENQLSRFLQVASSLPRAPLSIANSAGIALGCGIALDFSRPGKSVFGIGNSFENDVPIRPTARVIAPVVQVRAINKGEAVGYGLSWVAERKSTLATVSLGYHDGLQRAAANGGKLSYRGSSFPIVGRVSMDLVTVDLTDMIGQRPAEGDWVDVVDDAGFSPLAKVSGTIEHEIAIAMGKNCYRTYK